MPNMPTSSYQFFKMRCHYARHNNSSFAKDWQWIGVPIIAFITTTLTSHFKVRPDMITTGNSILDGVLAGFAAYYFIWGVGFIVAFFYAPAVLYRELEQKNEALQKELLDRKARKGNIAALIALYSWGVAHKNSAVYDRAVKNHQEWKFWGAKHDEWATNIRNAGDSLSAILGTLLWEVPEYNIAKHPPFYNPSYDTPAFRDQYFIMCDRLDKIESYLATEMYWEQGQYYVTR